MIENLKDNNKILLCGRFLEAPTFSHSVKDEKFYTSVIYVNRLSNYEDKLLVTISGNLLDKINIKAEDYYKVFGQLRTYNKHFDAGNKLVLTVFAIAIEEIGVCNNVNSINLHGFICKEPVFRITPFNREICDLLLAVNRGHNKSDYIPCICWGNNAKSCSELKVGDQVSIAGRMQSREYEKKCVDGNCEKRTAYEVSVSAIKAIHD